MRRKLSKVLKELRRLDGGFLVVLIDLRLVRDLEGEEMTWWRIRIPE